jgi:hypothetical protein
MRLILSTILTSNTSFDILSEFILLQYSFKINERLVEVLYHLTLSARVHYSAYAVGCKLAMCIDY